jgi:hypothetical protein
MKSTVIKILSTGQKIGDKLAKGYRKRVSWKVSRLSKKP